MCRARRFEPLSAPSASGRAAHSTALPLAAPASAAEVVASSGSPLDAATRAFMESRFDHDFSRVRVHTGIGAAQSAQALSAMAYTVGHDIVFGSGLYAPATEGGQRLLAHELVHTIQQTGAMSTRRHDSMHVSSSAPRVQRAPDCESGKAVDPDYLGPAFVRKKSEIQALGLRKRFVKPPLQKVPYVLYSPHCEGGKIPLKGLVKGSGAFLATDGDIYRQVWTEQQDKSADVLYRGWIDTRLLTLRKPKSKPKSEAKPTLALDNQLYGSGTIRFNVTLPNPQEREKFVIVQWHKGCEIGRDGNYARLWHFGGWSDFNYPDWVVDSPDRDPVYASVTPTENTDKDDDDEEARRWNYIATDTGFRSSDRPSRATFTAVKFRTELHKLEDVAPGSGDAPTLPAPLDVKEWDFTWCKDGSHPDIEGHCELKDCPKPERKD